MSTDLLGGGDLLGYRGGAGGSHWSGQRQGQRRAGAVWQLAAAFQPGEVMLADALYGHYVLIATWVAAGVDRLFEQPGSRRTDVRPGRSLGPHDPAVCWPTPARPACLIGLLMAQAASIAGVDPRKLGYKHTCQRWNGWLSPGLKASADANCLFTLIAQVPVGNRPNRIEPRMRKRRPKSYPWLKEPRRVARERVRKYGHPKRR